MGFETPFIAENQPDSLYDFGFYKIQRQTKSAIVGMLTNFFSSLNSSYRLQMPEILEMQNTAEVTKIFINKDFPYQERKLPLILVAIKGSTERKLYLGADNLSCYDIVETSTGKKSAVNIYHGAADITLALIIIALSPEDRMKFAELVTMCFTHYYRWQYFYTYGDGNMFSIVPNTAQLEFGSEAETTDVSTTSLLYLVDITMKSFIEYTFRDLRIYGVLKDYAIEGDSGPISPWI